MGALLKPQGTANTQQQPFSHVIKSVSQRPTSLPSSQAPHHERDDSKTRMSPWGSLWTMWHTRPAVPADAPALFDVVNNAYVVELGDTGVAFKSKQRFPTVDDALAIVPDCHVVEEGGRIVGCVTVYVADEDDSSVPAEDRHSLGRLPGAVYAGFGPLAVHQDMQGRGLGSFLVDFAERHARETLGASVMEITVVNWRTDVQPYYAKRGYVVSHETPFNSPFVTRPSRFVIMRKPLA